MDVYSVVMVKVRIRAACVYCMWIQLKLVLQPFWHTWIHLAPFTSQLSNTYSHFHTNTLTHTKTHSVLSPVTLILAVHWGPVSESGMSKSSCFVALAHLLTSPVNWHLSSRKRQQAQKTQSRGTEAHAGKKIIKY